MTARRRSRRSRKSKKRSSGARTRPLRRAYSTHSERPLAPQSQRQYSTCWATRDTAAAAVVDVDVVATEDGGAEAAGVEDEVAEAVAGELAGAIGPTLTGASTAATAGTRRTTARTAAKAPGATGAENLATSNVTARKPWPRSSAARAANSDTTR